MIDRGTDFHWCDSACQNALFLSGIVQLSLDLHDEIRQWDIFGFEFCPAEEIIQEWWKLNGFFSPGTCIDYLNWGGPSGVLTNKGVKYTRILGRVYVRIALIYYCLYLLSWPLLQCFTVTKIPVFKCCLFFFLFFFFYIAFI